MALRQDALHFESVVLTVSVGRATCIITTALLHPHEALPGPPVIREESEHLPVCSRRPEMLAPLAPPSSAVRVRQSLTPPPTSPKK